MAKPTTEYIRRSYMELFARMTREQREGVLEGLQVMHEVVLGKEGSAALTDSEPTPITLIGPCD